MPTHPSHTAALAGLGPNDSIEPIAQQLMPGVATPTSQPVPPSSNFTPRLSARAPGTASPPVAVARQVSGIVRRRSPSPPAPLPPPHLAPAPGSSKSSASIRVNSPSLNAGASPRVLVQSPSPRSPALATADEPASARGSLGRRHAVPASWGLQGSPHPGTMSGGSMKVARPPLQQGSPQAAPTSGGSVSVAMLPLQQGQASGGSLHGPPTFNGSMSVPTLQTGRPPTQAMYPAQVGAQPVASAPQQWSAVAAPLRAGLAKAPGAPLLRHGVQSPR